MRVPGPEDPETLAREVDTSALAEAVDRIAHQLKNPLQAMTVNLEVLRMRADAAGGEETERVTGVIDENIRLVDRRIRMLIALARRSPEESLTGIDLPALVRDAGAAFRLDEREDGLGLRIRAPDAGQEALAIRAREGELLALFLAAAAGAPEAGDGERGPYLAVGRSERGAWVEVGPRSPWGDEGEREELLRQARRAGGEVPSAGREAADEAGGEPGADAPFRVLFPRA